MSQETKGSPKKQCNVHRKTGTAGSALLVLVAVGCAMEGSNENTGTVSQALPCFTCGTGNPPPPPPRDAGTPKDTGTTTTPPPPSGGTFTVQALGHMCLDFGGQAYWAVGAPVTLYWCNGTIAQEFDVQEVGGHDVNLHVGIGTDNDYCIGSRGGPAVGAVLEMETCNGSVGQEFALDGDSIIAGPLASAGGHIARQYVAKPQNDVTNAKTPIVLGLRELNENEYLRFVATDTSGRVPHSGFVARPTSGAALKTALGMASWGTVIEVPESPVIYTLNGTLNAPIPAGVTLRGYRKFTDNGPLIEDDINEVGDLFVVEASDVRITGLRFQGAEYGTGSDPSLGGIAVNDGNTVTIDHNEFSQFTTAAVKVTGNYDDTSTTCPVTTPPLPAQPRPVTVRVSGNSFFHNVASSQGYGVSSKGGSFPIAERNVGYTNRHTITAGYDSATGYLAQDNLLLSDTAVYTPDRRLQDIDAHGSDGFVLLGIDWDSTYYNGGSAGDYVQVFFNTFLRTDGPNVKIRGQSCRQGTLDQNVFTQARGFSDPADDGAWIPEAVDTLDVDGTSVEFPVDFDVTVNNQFGVENPMDNLAVGDFDGDGIDDVFVATGTGWFYSSGGQSEWRWLRRDAETTPSLRFGDLDGDGRTDVIAVHTLGTLDVSWGGVSNWMALTSTPAAVPIDHFAIGNFDGDTIHGNDVFMSTGAAWFIAPSGHNFAPAQTSSAAVSDLRFGDFDGDGKTDVFAIVGTTWSISSDAHGAWMPLPGAPSTGGSPTGLVVGDFDGDGITDMGFYYSEDGNWEFEYSKSARNVFQYLRSTASPAMWAGRFEGTVRSDAIWWDSYELDIGTGTDPGRKLSRQFMR
jgi:hypothetical protein